MRCVAPTLDSLGSRGLLKRRLHSWMVRVVWGKEAHQGPGTASRRLREQRGRAGPPLSNARRPLWQRGGKG